MRVDELESALLEERAEPDQDFARRLDEWADAGFPRDRGLGPKVFASIDAGPTGTLRRAWARISSVPPRHLLMPVGAAATVLVVAGVALSQVDKSGVDRRGEADTGSGEPATVSEDSAPATPEVESGENTDAGGAATDAVEAAPPAAQSVAPEELTEPGFTGGAAGGGEGVAPATDDRLIDATARLTLGAETEDVQGVANEVVAVTDRYDGVVLDSQVTSDQGGARAAFTLEIPYSDLDSALTDLSALTDVISRTEVGEDITQGAVRSHKQLAKVLEDLNNARIELDLAETRRERLILASRIDSLAASADALRADVGQTERRARFATVIVDITSNGSGSDDDGWSLSEALDDAGRVLEVIGGVALISLAVLLPLALVGTVIYLGMARARRRSRERALDGR